jgi:hypothetical protein
VTSSTGIVITTSPASAAWLPACLASVQQYAEGRPILVVGNLCAPDLPTGVEFVQNDWNAWELGGIYRGAQRFEQFVHLMDTTEVLSAELFRQMDTQESGVYLCDGFFSYLGKYLRRYIEPIGIPKITTKQEAIACEGAWNAAYLHQDRTARPYTPMLPIHTKEFVTKHDRLNMVLTNGHIVKWKGTWGA